MERWKCRMLDLAERAPKLSRKVSCSEVGMTSFPSRNRSRGLAWARQAWLIPWLGPHDWSQAWTKGWDGDGQVSIPCTLWLWWVWHQGQGVGDGSLNQKVLGCGNPGAHTQPKFQRSQRKSCRSGPQDACEMPWWRWDGRR